MRLMVNVEESGYLSQVFKKSINFEPPVYLLLRSIQGSSQRKDYICIDTWDG